MNDSKIVKKTPQEAYRAALATEGFVADTSQSQAVDHLQSLYEALAKPTPPRSLFDRVLGRDATKVPLTGLYFWGGVGRGKTYLMDIFYDALPFERKLRLHFHRFMRRVHKELSVLKGEVNPLEKVADKLADEARVLCFDEFFVSDITDAMILATLLDALFQRGVTLVATSNIPPDSLYKDGLQRSRFLPAIALLEKFTQVVNLDGGVDYRLRALERLQLYHSPLGQGADEIMRDNFLRLVADTQAIAWDTSIDVEERDIPARAVCEDVIWFDFAQICDGPRSQNDYIELSREFHSVLIANVPEFDNTDDVARRFVNLIDEFYDRSVNVVISAEVPLDRLYANGRLSFEFERTKSRLLEMQSTEYLGRTHLAEP